MTQNHGESIMAAKRSLTFATVTPITISIRNVIRKTALTNPRILMIPLKYRQS